MSYLGATHRGVYTLLFPFSSWVLLHIVGGRPAPKKVRAPLRTLLEFEADAEVLVTSEARYSALACSKKNDVVLIREGSSYRAGQVLLHARVTGVTVSLVSLWSLRSINTDVGFAKWNVDDSKMLIETSDIIDNVCHTKLGGSVVSSDR